MGRKLNKKKVKGILSIYAWLVIASICIAFFVDTPLVGLFMLGGCTIVYLMDPADEKKIKVKYFDDRMKCLEKISVGDWVDLRSAEDVTLLKGEYYLIRLGVGMILPDGYEAHVLPRSSTPSKFGIMCANSMGIIDNSYSGDADEWKFPAVAIRDTEIKRGDRICQFRIVKNQPSLKFEIVSRLRNISRGGIGSTGKR